MSLRKLLGMTRISISKHRNLWISLLLFVCVLWTGIILLVNWQEISRGEVFRCIVQMLIFSIWSVDLFRRYREQKSSESESSEA